MRGCQHLVFTALSLLLSDFCPQKIISQWPQEKTENFPTPVEKAGLFHVRSLHFNLTNYYKSLFQGGKISAERSTSCYTEVTDAVFFLMSFAWEVFSLN